MKKIHYFLFAALLLCLSLHKSMAQGSPFGIYLEPLSVSGLPGIQSYSFGQSGGKWLVVGGHTQVVSAATELAPGAYLVRISTQTESAVQRIIIR